MKKKVQKKTRNKSRSLVVASSPREREKLANFWIAGGHCLAVNECSEANPINASFVTSSKRQWSILVLMCCIDEAAGSNHHESAIKVVDRHVDQDELQQIIDGSLHSLYQIAKEKDGISIVSPAFFAVPSVEVDLEQSIGDVVDRFTSWGAFNNDICGVAYTLREMRYA